jgi:hypothetical protein
MTGPTACTNFGIPGRLLSPPERSAILYQRLIAMTGQGRRVVARSETSAVCSSRRPRSNREGNHQRNARRYRFAFHHDTKGTS